MNRYLRWYAEYSPWSSALSHWMDGFHNQFGFYSSVLTIYPRHLEIMLIRGFFYSQENAIRNTSGSIWPKDVEKIVPLPFWCHGVGFSLFTSLLILSQSEDSWHISKNCLNYEEYSQGTDVLFPYFVITGEALRISGILYVTEINCLGRFDTCSSHLGRRPFNKFCSWFRNSNTIWCSRCPHFWV